MAYSTITDIKKLLPEEALIELTDDENTGAVNDARVTEAIAAADAEIDGYVGGRYGVPLSPVPTAIKRLSVDMAVYHLYSRRQEIMPETRQVRYDNCVRFLRDVAAGRVSLGIEPEPDSATDSTIKVSAPDRDFGDDFKEQW